MRFPAVGFHDFCRRADEIVDSLPAVLLRGLNGGVQVDRRARRRPDDPPGVYLLGEYVVDPFVGRLVLVYYGSFCRVFAEDPKDVWLGELDATIRHELRHHVEDLGGLDDLNEEDREELVRLWREAREAEAREPDEGEAEARGEGGSG